MKKPNLIHITKWAGQKCKFNLYLSDSFDHLKDVRQVYGIILNNNKKIVLVAGKSKKWILPGGGVEKGETLIDTLKREAIEEAAIEIEESFIRPFFYQEAYLWKNNKWTSDGIQVRFITKIYKRNKFVKDPDCRNIKFQMFSSIPELHRYLKWGKSTSFIQEYLPKILS